MNPLGTCCCFFCCSYLALPALRLRARQGHPGPSTFGWLRAGVFVVAPRSQSHCPRTLHRGCCHRHFGVCPHLLFSCFSPCCFFCGFSGCHVIYRHMHVFRFQTLICHKVASYPQHDAPGPVWLQLVLRRCSAHAPHCSEGWTFFVLSAFTCNFSYGDALPSLAVMQTLLMSVAMIIASAHSFSMCLSVRSSRIAMVSSFRRLSALSVTPL